MSNMSIRILTDLSSKSSFYSSRPSNLNPGFKKKRRILPRGLEFLKLLEEPINWLSPRTHLQAAKFHACHSEMKKCRQYAEFIRFSPFFVVQLRLWICLRSKLSKQIVHNHLPGKAKRVYPRNSTNWISSAVHTLKKKGICWTPNVLQSNWQAGLQRLSISYFDIIYDLFGIRKSFAQRLEQETDALSCVDVWRIISNVSQTV